MTNIYYSNIIIYWTILPSNDWFHLRKEYSTILGTFHTLRHFQKKANKNTKLVTHCRGLGPLTPLTSFHKYI